MQLCTTKMLIFRAQIKLLNRIAVIREQGNGSATRRQSSSSSSSSSCNDETELIGWLLAWLVLCRPQEFVRKMEIRFGNRSCTTNCERLSLDRLIRPNCELSSQMMQQLAPPPPPPTMALSNSERNTKLNISPLASQKYQRQKKGRC